MAVEEALGQDYVLHEEIGRGATGVVRRATRRDGGPPLAAKLLNPELAGDRKVRNLFLQEEAVLRNLDNDAIVTIREIVVERGQLALLMELVEGPNLRTYLANRGGTLPPEEACAMAAQVATGLAAAHAQGVVHLDLKPENLLVQPGARPHALKIADFGLAALLLDAGRERPSSTSGTPGYIAPELAADGAPTAAADVFALGVVLVEMLTGTRPGTDGNPRSDFGVPEPLRPFVDACLSVDPRDRPTARAAAARLRETAPALAGMPAQPAASVAEPAVATGFARSTNIRNSDPPPTGAVGGADPARPGGMLRRLRGTRPTRTVVAMVASLVVAVAALTLGATAIYRNVAGDEQPAPPSASPPPSTSAPTFPATYAGRINGGGATIAIAVRDGEAVAYVCDGHRVEAWLSGTAVNGKLNLTGRGRASLTGVHDDKLAAGSATINGQRWQFRAPLVLPPSGLYRAAADVRNADVVAGWIVLADGTQVGIVTTDGKPTSAPSLDTERRTATVDGTQVTASQVDGVTDVGS